MTQVGPVAFDRWFSHVAESVPDSDSDLNPAPPRLNPAPGVGASQGQTGLRGFKLGLIVQELIRFQFRDNRIVLDVSTIVLELLRAADKVIKLIDLPKRSAAVNKFVDRAGGIPFPVFTLLEHEFFLRKRAQKVDVIRHDDRISYQVVLLIEMQQGIKDDLRTLWLRQPAIAGTNVHIFVTNLEELPLNAPSLPAVTFGQL